MNANTCFKHVTAVFDFTRPLGVFHQKKIVFRLPSIIDTIYGNLCLRRAVFASNGFQLSLACSSLFIFGRIWSTRYCNDSSCWMYVFKKLIKLYRETSTVNYPAERGRRSKTGHLDGMFILCTLLISFERSGKLTNKIPYQLIMFPFLCPVSKWHFTHKNIIPRDIFRWNTRMDRVSINKI